jgi:hypothetical protein
MRQHSVMKRRFVMEQHCCLAIFMGFLFFLMAAGTRAASISASSGLDADTMKVVLHTATPEEDGFISRVLALVDSGTLPVDMVKSTFLWAKKKTRHKFQYFKYGLIQRAKQAGIVVQ